MFVTGFPAGQLAANCYVLAAGQRQPCVIVDPGQDAVSLLATALDEHQLNPAAVLLTHGHFDHVFSAADIAKQYDIPVYIHPADRHLLTDPAAGLGPWGTELFSNTTWSEPTQVAELVDGQTLSLAGLDFRVIHTPGHTAGSVCFYTSTAEGGQLVITGDTLFAGAIGRSDLPGGDTTQLMESLQTKLLSLPDDTAVLPGHGSPTTIGRERAQNPFLAGFSR